MCQVYADGHWGPRMLVAVCSLSAGLFLSAQASTCQFLFPHAPPFFSFPQHISQASAMPPRGMIGEEGSKAGIWSPNASEQVTPNFSFPICKTRLVIVNTLGEEK